MKLIPWHFFLKFFYLILFSILPYIVWAQSPIVLFDGFNASEKIEQGVFVFKDENNLLSLEQIKAEKFIPIQEIKESLQTKTNYWLRFQITSQDDFPKDYYLYFGDWAYIKVFVERTNGQTVEKQTGRFVKLEDRSLQRSEQYIPVSLNNKEKLTIYVCLRQEMAFYNQSLIQVWMYNEAFVTQETRQKLFYQGIFLGIILVMALYNLFIYISVKDNSSLYYVFSIVGVGLYFMFYYGFTLELFWGNYPIWNSFSFVLIVPLTRITWVLFTKNYLHLDEVLPQWNKTLNLLILIYFVPMILGLVSFFTDWDFTLVTVNLIGTLGIIVLTMMLLMGFFSWQKGYQPAFYFLIANLFFSIGSILFIFRETGWLPDNFFTRYSPQLGVVVQVVLFSLGLANRINTSQQELAQKALDNERLEREKETERKELIEAQKGELEKLVEQRTADLKSKTSELEIIVQKLQESETNLKELNHVKDNFFSIISHDLRSPLATLTSFLNILTNFSTDFSEKEIKALAQKTQQSVKNLSFLLDNLLQWAMTQMDMTIYEPEKIKLTEVLKETESYTSVYAEEKQIEVEVNADHESDIYMDRNILAFVLRNLLMNAIKFTYPKGKISIIVQKNGDSLEMIVQDNGIGISEEHIDRIFDYKQKVATRGTSNEKGTGLGLMLCKEFIEKSGGSIYLESRIGEGSKFYCYFPLLILRNQ